MKSPGKQCNIWRGKNCRTTSGIRIHNVLNPLTHCPTLLDDTFRKETIHKIRLDFIDYFEKSP